jgi:signal transduction histidine kinase/CheY-like chemotaxis protein
MVHAYVPEGFRATIVDCLRRVVDTGSPDRYEVEYRDDEGRPSWFESFVGPVTHEGEVVALIINSRDVTERKRTDEVLRHTQKLESLGVMAGGIAHDFNNLLMGILGNASLSLVELPESLGGRKRIEAIENAARRAADLTRQLLAYSGKAPFVLERIDLNSVVTEMTNLLQTAVSKKTRLDLHLAEGLPRIEADPTQVRQIAMNLITNASEAQDAGDGVVKVSTGVTSGRRAPRGAKLFVGELTDEEYAFLEIVDGGIGMSDETVERIFDPFFTTKFAGRGLGLAAVLGIVRTHGGGLRVDSEPGTGSTFTVLFPVAGTCRDDVQPGEGETGVGWTAEGTVLVVDDEDVVRSFAEAALTTAGFRILTAADGKEATEIFRDRRDEITVVLLDMTMPKMDGVETLRALRGIDAAVPVVLMSGYAEDDATKGFDDLRPDGFLQKPFGPAALLDKIRHVVGRKL